jgi:hypothetical protein
MTTIVMLGRYEDRRTFFLDDLFIHLFHVATINVDHFWMVGDIETEVDVLQKGNPLNLRNRPPWVGKILVE